VLVNAVDGLAMRGDPDGEMVQVFILVEGRKGSGTTGTFPNRIGRSTLSSACET
jgi:hypothetical protein